MQPDCAPLVLDPRPGCGVETLGMCFSFPCPEDLAATRAPTKDAALARRRAAFAAAFAHSVPLMQAKGKTFAPAGPSAPKSGRSAYSGGEKWSTLVSVTSAGAKTLKQARSFMSNVYMPAAHGDGDDDAALRDVSGAIIKGPPSSYIAMRVQYPRAGRPSGVTPEQAEGPMNLALAQIKANGLGSGSGFTEADMTALCAGLRDIICPVGFAEGTLAYAARKELNISAADVLVTAAARNCVAATKPIAGRPGWTPTQAEARKIAASVGATLALWAGATRMDPTPVPMTRETLREISRGHDAGKWPSIRLSDATRDLLRADAPQPEPEPRASLPPAPSTPAPPLRVVDMSCGEDDGGGDPGPIAASPAPPADDDPPAEERGARRPARGAVMASHERRAAEFRIRQRKEEGMLGAEKARDVAIHAANMAYFRAREKIARTCQQEMRRLWQG